ncbi:cytochrome bd oxidase small subunit CydS [Bacillus thermotolerans]|uniref:Uncharacterized protein n=1 Tax=Bacillus thermotolerans TaxID=1221996 RepID=A0A0F5HL40_BACTR|nr:hypothetical protein QY97_02688 [Bacillus thermotolerans]KKB35238.1 hypothetical protein QY95_03527 [Bacillus thermotolerans]KKB40542.1 hypothetical protein QY96_02374 [Bacillus thermotolerans]
MQEFLMFYAPFIVLIGAIILAFISAVMDKPVSKGEAERK